MTGPVLLYLAWQDPDSRAWFPIGALCEEGSRFVFEYVRGVLGARDHGFVPLPDFPDPTRRYSQEELFALFRTRGLNPRRPEYGQFLSWLDLDGRATGPVEILTVSGGRRATDRLQMFAPPRNEGDGWRTTRFFVHGSRYFSTEVLDRLQPGEVLLPVLDPMNPVDSHAVLLTTGPRAQDPRQPLGYLPRYLAPLVRSAVESAEEAAHRPMDTCEVRVVKVNGGPEVPETYRLLCSLRVRLPAEEVLGGPEFEPAAGLPEVAKAFPSRRGA